MTALETARLMFAGGAVFTIVHRRSGYRFVYKISRSAVDGEWNIFCKEGKKFIFMFTAKASDRKAHYSRHSEVDDEHPHTEMICFVMYLLDISIKSGSVRAINDAIGVMWSGKCCRCGKRLTDPKSIKNKIGPTCLEKLKSEARFF